MNPTQGIERTIPPELEAIDRACAELREGLLAPLPAPDRFSVELLLREALTNAVLHGGKDAGRSPIVYSVRLQDGEIVIRVDDGGAGFDWHNWRRPELPPVEEYGMGLQLLHRYASQVRFLGNGNTVELVRTSERGRAS